MQESKLEREKVQQFARLAPRWFEIFKEAPVPVKKKMLSHVIDQVTPWEDRLEISYNVNLVDIGQVTREKDIIGGDFQLRIVADL